MVELLRQLERRANAPIWTLFDVIGGTSTGGLLAVSLGVLRLNLDACQEIYTSLGNKVCTCTLTYMVYVHLRNRKHSAGKHPGSLAK